GSTDWTTGCCSGRMSTPCLTAGTSAWTRGTACSSARACGRTSATATSSTPRPGRSSTCRNVAPTGPAANSWNGTSTRSSSTQPQPDQALTRSGVLLVTRVGVDQFIEFVEQGAQRVPGGDDLAVRCRDHRLPPAVSGPDDARRIVLAEPVQAKHLVIFVRYQPQPARSFLHFAPPGVRRICPAMRLGSRGCNGPQRREGREPGPR